MMIQALAAPVVLAALAAATAATGDDAARRLVTVVRSVTGAGSAVEGTSRRPAGAHARPAGDIDGRSVQLACVVAGAAVALIATAPTGIVAGAVLALLGPAGLRRLQPPAWRLDDEAAARDLPLALDLLAACLSGGAPLDHAVGAVARAVPGACGRRLSSVAGALAVGTAPAEAWQLLSHRPAAEGASSRQGHASTAPTAAGAAARALARAADGGAPVAASVSRIAASARADAAASACRSARRAGVMAVGPLGLCFLPAFVLLGVVPAIAGLAGPLLAGL